MSQNPDKTLLLLNKVSELDRKAGIPPITKEIKQNTKDLIEKWNNENDKIIYEGEETVVCIGFDFGTSSTKVIVRTPYENNKSSAFPVPEEFQMDDHPHLWKTLVYFNEKNSEFSLFPQEGFKELTDIKTILMDNQKNNLVSVISKKIKQNFTIKEVTTAYFALLFRIIKGWTVSEAFRPENVLSSNSLLKSISKWFFNETQNDNMVQSITNPMWTLNVGFPAKNLETKLKETFDKIVKKAWALSFSNKKITSENILGFKINIEDKEKFSKDYKCSITVLPEVVAESIGFMKTDKADHSQYLMIDVGASTLDICFFDYNNLGKNNEDQYTIDKTNVVLLGAQIGSWSSELKEFNKTDLIDAINISIVKVVNATKFAFPLTSNPRYKIWGTEKLPVILGGGGINSKLHKDAFEKLNKVLSINLIPKGIEFKYFEKPKEVKTLINDKFYRLSVAWGLSFPDVEFTGYFLPKDQTHNRPKIKHFADNFIGKDQV
tara:strand:- start:1998 stop:3470 length:1473 start_codon:yes stop_codon:yes gene_type:complete